VAFRVDDPLGNRKLMIFEADSLRLTRSRTYASPAPSPGTRRKARFRVVRARPSRTGFSPAGRQTEFQKLPHCFLPSDQPCLVAPSMHVY
jgi:hypothetical protein